MVQMKFDLLLHIKSDLLVCGTLLKISFEVSPFKSSSVVVIIFRDISGPFA